jgi:nitrite reductase/ring-hydroxylating ferredoxin subunit
MAFQKVARVSDLPPGAARCVHVKGRRIAIFNVGGALRAIDDVCPHAEASLAEGEVVGGEIVCPLHFATFDLATGACTGPPASDDLRVYPTRINGADVEIDV